MNIRSITSIVILSAVVILLGYDVFAIYKGGTEASISHMVIEWSYKYPIFTFSFGVLCGHFFWRVRGGKILRKIEDNTRGEVK